MAQVSDNAGAAFVVFAWDGTQVGVVSGWDSHSEAQDDAKAREDAAPDHVKYFATDQAGLRKKVAELTGVDESAFADPENTRPKNVEGSTAPDAVKPVRK